MKIQAKAIIMEATIVFGEGDLEAFSYWFGNRHDTTPVDRPRWERGAALALQISMLSRRVVPYEDQF